MQLEVQGCEQPERSFKRKVKIVISRIFVEDRKELNGEFLSFHLARKKHARQLEYDRLHF